MSRSGTDPIVDGDVNGNAEADASAVPVRGETLAESKVVADDVAALDACLGAGVNQEAGISGAPATGNGGTDPNDGGSGNGPVRGGDADEANRGAPGDTSPRGDAGLGEDPGIGAGATPSEEAGAIAGNVTDGTLYPAVMTELAFVEDVPTSVVDAPAGEEQAFNAASSGNEAQGEAAPSGDGQDPASGTADGEQRASGSDSSDGQGGNSSRAADAPRHGRSHAPVADDRLAPVGPRRPGARRLP